jgi:hypothetical protein
VRKSEKRLEKVEFDGLEVKTRKVYNRAADGPLHPLSTRPAVPRPVNIGDFCVLTRPVGRVIGTAVQLSNRLAVASDWNATAFSKTDV